VVSKQSCALVASLVVMSGAWAFARGQNNKGVEQQSDPVEQAIAHGVDHIDPTDAAPAPALDRRNSRYRIASEDVLDLQFQSTPEFNQTVTVQPDGYITLREVGDIQVEGDTLPELRQAVQSAYLKILANPVISIELKDSHGRTLWSWEKSDAPASTTSGASLQFPRQWPWREVLTLSQSTPRYCCFAASMISGLRSPRLT